MRPAWSHKSPQSTYSRAHHHHSEFLLAALSPHQSNLSHGESSLSSQSAYTKLRKIRNPEYFFKLSSPAHTHISCLPASAAEDNLWITYVTYTLMSHLFLILSPHCVFFYSQQLFRLFCLVLPALPVHANKPKKSAIPRGVLKLLSQPPAVALLRFAHC